MSPAAPDRPGALVKAMLGAMVALAISGVAGAVATYAKTASIEAVLSNYMGANDSRMDRLEDKIDRLIDRGSK